MILGKEGQNLLQVLEMFFIRFVVYQYVVEEHNNTFAQ